MTDGMGYEDDDGTIIVEVSDEQAEASQAAPRTGKGGQCRECGKELDDGRKKYCDDHKPANAAKKRTATGGRSSSVKGVSSQVSNGMNGVTAKMLYVITLFIAYQSLRANGIPDPTGDISDAMALTDDEALMIGRPLTRLFLSTEQGKKVAPTIVANEDVIDAVFAAWDWWKRMNDTMEQYGRQASVYRQEPMTTDERSSTNAAQQAVATDNGNGAGGLGDIGPVFIPPSPQDIVGDI